MFKKNAANPPMPDNKPTNSIKYQIKSFFVTGNFHLSQGQGFKFILGCTRGLVWCILINGMKYTNVVCDVSNGILIMSLCNVTQIASSRQDIQISKYKQIMWKGMITA